MSALATLKHHADVAKAAWKDQRERSVALDTRGRSKREELAFMPAAIEITDTPAAPLGRVIMISISAFFAITIGWASIGEMDIIATSQGKIISSERVKMIQPLESGVVRAIHVLDGAHVNKGDILVELNPTGSEADREKLSRELMTTEVELARLTALLQPEPLGAFFPPEDAAKSLVDLHLAYLKSEIQQQRSERASLDGEVSRRKAEIRTVSAGIQRLQNKLTKVKDRAEGSRKLFEKGIVAKLKYGEAQEELSDVEGELDVQQRRFTESQAALRSATAQAAQKRAEFQRDIYARETEARSRASSIEQELIKAVERKRLLTLRAPISGRIQQLDVHTIGGVVTPAQPLMQIVPENSEIEVEALILNKDIGFVHATQEAEIKVESFPFTKYGTIDGHVRQVYADAIEKENIGLAYPARISMAKSTILVRDKHVELTPGMAVTIEIKTGKRKIIDYILAPLQEYQDESLKEQ